MARRQGRIRFWKDDRGYGFIEQNEGGDDVFVHIRSIGGLDGRPVGGERVTYDLTQDEQGRARAANVLVIPDVPPSRRAAVEPQKRVQRSSPLSLVLIIFASTFLVILFGLGLLKEVPVQIGGFYAILSLATFFAYMLDKFSAQTGGWRTKENTLHLMGLAGGWPGAIIAQHLFRHKTKKEDFVNMFWLTVLLNCVALGFLLGPTGEAIRAELSGR